MNNPVETLEHAIDRLDDQIESVLPPPRSPWRRLLGALAWLFVAAYFVFAVLVLALRYWVLPNIGNYTADIAAAISSAAGERVSIGGIEAGWQGLRPYLELADVRVHDRKGEVALALPEVNAVVSWLSVPTASLRFHAIDIVSPSLAIRRDAEGRFYVAGLEIRQQDSGSGFSDWVLAQSDVAIRDARISWEDERRKAPRLDLADVEFRLTNRGGHHRFALKADPPRDLASALDVRGDFSGGSLAQLQEWNGQLYAGFEYTNLAEWKRWFDYPFDIQRGKGGLRLWLSLAQGRPTELVADVSLAGVATRLARDLPQLELESLQGRIGARDAKDGFEVFGRRIAMKPVSGPTLAPADFSFTGHTRGTDRVVAGNLQANTLELDPLVWLAEFLPIPADARTGLGKAAPKGSVNELKLEWAGELPALTHFSARGRFSRLGMNPYAGIPGFSGLSGNIDGNERTGTLALTSEKAVVELPGLLADPKLVFDTLTGQVAWGKTRDGRLELRASNLTVANADLAGSGYGSWQAAAPGEGAGVIDITARLTRADGRATPRYLPAFVGDTTRNWLTRALVAARSNDVRFRIKGDTREFPWDGGKTGQFQIVAKVQDGTLDYVEGWPRLSNVAADVSFEGKALTVYGPRATILGAKLSNVRVGIADLLHHDEVLTIEGLADGPTSEFLKFITASPVAGMIEHFTDDAQAQGAGRLGLRIDLPLRRLADLKVAGNYQFTNNTLQLDSDFPALTQVNGRLDFTESGVSVRGINAQLLGGPVQIAAATRDGALGVTATGNINAAAIRRFSDMPLTRAMQGATAWRGNLTVRKRNVDVVLTSDLQGMALDLPAPFGKAAAETLPLRVERVNLIEGEAAKRGLRGARGEVRADVRGDAITASLGAVLSMQLLRRREGDDYRVERGGIGINEAAAVPDRAGIQVSGSLRNLDVNRWRAVFGGSAGGAAAADLPVNTVNLRLNTLDVGAKRLNEVNLRAARGSGQWQANVTARELSGEILWRSSGRGALMARLKHLSIPDNRPGAGTDPAPPSDELPAIDLIADNFVSRDKKFGKLELQAVNEASEWRIDKLVLSNPDGTLSADGVWKLGGQGATSVNVKIEVGDVGKYLDRLGYPGTVGRGTARIDGKLSWSGSPQDFDYPSLAGNLKLLAEKGQFLKVEPGIAKLIGILSLQSLPKRIALDFRDVFSDGFAFDAMQGNVTIARGIASTQDFGMQGSAAAVAITGEADLARETQNLKVRVVPALGDSLSTVAGLLLANPVTGIGAMLAQRLFNNPLGQIFAYDYSVTGNWADPKVEKISGARAATSTPAPAPAPGAAKP